MRAAARRARDNRRLASRARAEKRFADARRYEAHATKADRVRWDARDAVPPGPVAVVERYDVEKARARKALLASLEADGFTQERGYDKQYGTAEFWKNDIVLVARDGRGRVIGAAGLRVFDREVDVHDLWVIADAQRSGAGTELMAQAAHLATRLAKKGRPTMSVTSALHEAQPFYTRCGAVFAAGSQMGRWDEPRVLFELASKARFVDGPPSLVVSVEQDADEWVKNEVDAVRRHMADREARGLGRTVDPAWLAPTNERGFGAGCPWLSRDEVVARLRARGLPV